MVNCIDFIQTAQLLYYRAHSHTFKWCVFMSAKRLFSCPVSTFVPGAQSDSELSFHHPSEVSLDRGYTSDSEVYTEHGKSRMPRSVTDVDVASSGWLVVRAHTHSLHLLTLFFRVLR